MAGRRRLRLPAWLVGSGAVAVAMAVMNLGTYGFTILAARLLGPVHYGAVAAVMGLLLVVNVLSLGLQATAARRVATAPQHTRAIEAQIMSASYRSALALGAVCLLAAPLVSRALQLDSWLTAALLALTAVPLTVMGGQLGVLQGERRWIPVALVYLTMGVGRLALGLVALLVRPDPLGAMFGVALGAFVPASVGWWALRSPRERGGQVSGDEAHITAGLFRELAHNAHALLAFFALSNTDVVLARIVLEQRVAGLYAAGLILAKAVLFLPQFVVVVAFPAMSASAGSARAQLRSLALVLAIGLVALAGVAALSGLALVFVGGHEYAAVRPALWAFALLGTLLAMLQVTVYGLVARQNQRAAFLIWAALAALVVGALLSRSVQGLLAVVTVVDATLLVVLLATGARRSAPEAAAPAAGAAPVG